MLNMIVLSWNFSSSFSRFWEVRYPNTLDLRKTLQSVHPLQCFFHSQLLQSYHCSTLMLWRGSFYLNFPGKVVCLAFMYRLFLLHVNVYSLSKEFLLFCLELRTLSFHVSAVETPKSGLLRNHNISLTILIIFSFRISQLLLLFDVAP